jgi:hypothetical protein
LSIFLNINSKHIADVLHSAKSRVIYAAPALDEVVASALINTAKKIGFDRVTVLLDISENVFRCGYGNIDGVTLLKENNISIKEAIGIRIGVLVCDNDGLVFSQPPLLIEAGKENAEQPNAMRVTLGQINEIVSAIIPKELVEDNRKQEPEIGKSKVSSVKIETLQKTLTDNPPQKFDIARKVQVFSTAIEFVELKLTGCEIQRHTVQIPTELLVGDVDLATTKQLKAGFNILEKSSLLSGDSIRDKVKKIRKDYTKSIPKYGNILLKSKKNKFNEALKELGASIKEFQAKVKSELDSEITQSQTKLAEMLIPAVKDKPPLELINQIQADSQTDEEVKMYIEDKLKGIFPTAESMIKAMSVDCIFKAITYETISNEDFQKQIKVVYRYINWDKMFEEYSAAPES